MNAIVKDVMSTHVVAVRKGASFKRAARLMYSRRVKRLPVTDANRRLVGHDITDASRHVKGVVAIRDRLSYPPTEHYTSSPGPLF